MAMTRDEAVDAILIALDRQQRTDTPKLASADPYMLASYCFDLTRKLHYVYRALRSTQRDDPFELDLRAFAAEVNADNREVDAAGERVEQLGLNHWEARARALERIIINQYRTIHEDHDALVQRALGQKAR